MELIPSPHILLSQFLPFKVGLTFGKVINIWEKFELIYNYSSYAKDLTAVQVSDV